MGCNLAGNQTPQAFENCGAPAMGLYGYPGPTIPDDSQYAKAAIQSTPSGAPLGYAALAEACLRARGLIYFKVNPGDCPSNPPSGITGAQIVGLSGQASAGVIGGLGAVGAISGAATFGIGAAVTLAVGAIESIFAEHAQAVANEQATICQVAGYFNGLCKQVDAAVASGSISAGQGITYLTQFVNAAKQGLASIQKTCNAACVYQAILNAFVIFAAYYYPVLAPQGPMALAPGAPPSLPGSLPGGVPSTSQTPAPAPPLRSVSTIAHNNLMPAVLVSPGLGYNQPSAQAAQAVTAPVTSINWFLILLALVGVFLLVRAL